MILDLFAGPGGWDVGLGLLGLEAVGVEIEEWASATRSKAGLETIRADVSNLDPARFKNVEGLIASPPCKDWSVAGRLAKKDGHTGWLVDEPERYVEVLRPTWIAQEQVVGALEVWQAQAHFYQGLGYHTWAGILSAECYGVPQTRQRAILIAHLEHPVSPPEPTHQRYVFGQPAREEVGLFGTLRPWVSMAEALGWGYSQRPSTTIMGTTGDSKGGPRPPDGGSGSRATMAKAIKAGEFILDTRCDPRDGRTQTRGLDEPAPTITTRSGRQWQLIQLEDPHLVMLGSNLRPTSRSVEEPAQTLAFGHNAAGWRWKDGPAEVHPGRDADWPFKRPSTTIMGDPRVFAPGGHHKGDPNNKNSESIYQHEGAIKIEPWEAAVLQSFPADYPFAGARTRQFTQIGDAVPPFLAAAIVGELTGRPWREIIAALLYPEETPTEEVS